MTAAQRLRAFITAWRELGNTDQTVRGVMTKRGPVALTADDLEAVLDDLAYYRAAHTKAERELKQIDELILGDVSL